MLVETLGWAAAVYSAFVALPQLARVARSRTTAGISLLAWQSSLAGSLSWGAYGVMADFPNIWIPNIGLVACAVWMLIMISRDQLLARFDFARLFGLPIMVAVATVSVAVMLGSLAFAAAVFIPAAVAQVMTLRSLVIAHDISAVSMPFLAMGVIGQLLWFGWGVLVDDISNQLVAGCLAVMIATNLLWYALRRFQIVGPRLRLADGLGLADRLALAEDPAVSELPIDPPADDTEDTLIGVLRDRSAAFLDAESHLAEQLLESQDGLLEGPASSRYAT